MQNGVFHNVALFVNKKIQSLILQITFNLYKILAFLLMPQFKKMVKKQIEHFVQFQGFVLKSQLFVIKSLI